MHARLELRDVAAGRREAGLDAPVLVHPECAKEVREAADHCLSTGGMCKFVKESPAERFVIGTEKGILHRLQKENPEKEFVAIGDIVCEDMKKITLEKVRDALEKSQYEVKVPEEVANRARKAIQRMLEVV